MWTWRHVSSTRNSCLSLACPSSTRLVVLLLSADSLVEPGADGMSPGVEYLHGETHGGMARHDLTLKVGALVMLTHNLKPADGLCNGTRLIVTKIPASRRCIRLLSVSQRQPQGVIRRAGCGILSGLAYAQW